VPFVKRTTRQRTDGVGAIYAADPVQRKSRILPNHRRMAVGQRTIVDREISKLFRPTWMSLLPGAKAHNSAARVEQLVVAESLLAKFFDFSRLDLARLAGSPGEEGVTVGRRDPTWDAVRQRLLETDTADLAELTAEPWRGRERCGRGAAAAASKVASIPTKTYSRYLSHFL
jgi:hypothetical protein